MQSFKKLFSRADFILILVLSVICVILFIPRFITTSKSQTAVIYKNGKVIERIDLNSVKNSYNISLDSKPNSIVQVDKGRIRYKVSHCPDKLCVKSGWLSKVGDTSACLPAKTMIVIEGQTQKDAPDAISY